MKRGFTLIELLVVIAIIGVLSAIVLASLNTARSKGNDASVKSSMHTIITQAALYADNHSGTYGSAGTVNCTGANTMFADDPTIKAAVSNVSANSDTVFCRMTIDGLTWAMYARLTNPSAGNAGWCIDSTGLSKEVPTVATPIKSCP